MRDQEDQGVLAVQLAQPGERLLVEQGVVAAQHPPAEPLPLRDDGLVVRGRHLPERAGRLGQHILLGSAEPFGEVAHLALEGRCPEQLGDLGGIRRPRFRRSPGQADAVQQAARADSVEDASAEVIQGVVGTGHDFPLASIGVRRFWPVPTAAAAPRGALDSPDSGCSAVGQCSRVST
jgi:hypothetical protein